MAIAITILCFAKNEKIVMEKRAIADVKAPTRNGFNSRKVRIEVE
jgi:hypothetical protein